MRFRILLLSLVVATTASAQITIEACLDSAEANYPLVRRYGLIEHTRELNFSDVNRSWLPSVGFYAQGSVQNAVPEFPKALTDVLSQMGQDFSGLGHAQYKVGVEVSQTLWDGGDSHYHREQERAVADVNRAALDVDMYAVRSRVQSIFFGILLLQEQIAQSEQTQALLEANHRRMQAAVSNGVATRSDADMIEAEVLTVAQKITRARSNESALRRVLAVFTGLSLEGKTLEKPLAAMPENLTPERPEQSFFDARIRAADVLGRSVGATLMPRFSLFGQAFYGYPGFDNFKSMRTRDMSFNVLAGVKVSWSIAPFYTGSNRRAKARVAALEASTDRDTFLFNTGMSAISQSEEIEGLRRAMTDDTRITELRRTVRRAAESQLENGVIDATALLAKITDENRAELTARYHEIELLQKIYELKNTLNR